MYKKSIYAHIKFMLKQMHIYNKKVIISDATPTITTNLKSGYKQKNSLLSHKIYHVANIKIEAI